MGKSERPIGGHFHHPEVCGFPLDHANVAIVREVRWPALDIGGEQEDARDVASHQALIESRMSPICRESAQRQ
jgi:hypothetical protein